MANDNKKRPKQGPGPVVDPGVDAPILAADRSYESETATLDTGMKVGEAIAQAGHWWDHKGRQMIQDKNFATDNPGFGAFNPNPQTKEEADNWLPSGILAGKPWTDLTKDEKLRVCKYWHHHIIRVPSIDPELYERACKRPGICFYCDDEAVADEQLMGEVREMCWAHFLDRYPDEAAKVFADQTKGPANDG